jgi:OOP family OmpA-OmpF porin
MKLRNTLVAAGLLALPAAAMAQPVDGFYVGAGAGYNFLQHQTIKNSGGGTLSTDGGPVAVVSAGYGFGNGFRLEVEGNYRSSNQDRNAASARNQTYGGFVNALYDFDIGSKYIFPYVGIGVGGVMQDVSKGVTATGVGFSGNKPDFAGQAIVGAAFPVAALPGLSATVEYRFMATASELSYGGVKLGNQYNNAALFGLRYAFNVAPPPPPPAPAPAPVAAPAPAPSRTYLVFFDWDKADLTERARQIIAEAAQNAARVQVTRIEVNGYTDASGTPQYNQKLSVKRAQNVAAELVKDGVPENEITVQGFGETHPLVPTAAGAREPQNRRVEIILK